MPYKLRITDEEVREELHKLGYKTVSDDVVSNFRKDLIRLIKADIKEMRRKRNDNKEEEFKSQSEPLHRHPLRLVQSQPRLFNPSISTINPESHTPQSFSESSSIPTSAHDLEQKIRKSSETKISDLESGYSECSTSESSSRTTCSSYTSDTRTSAESKVSKDSVDGRSREAVRPARTNKNRAPSLPSYPTRPDPVNLYHYYKAHWEKMPVPGEEAHNKLRWKVRTNLFYSK